MWRHWSAPVLKVICACFTPTGIHYWHTCSPEALARYRKCRWEIYLSITHICTIWLTDLEGCSVRIIIPSLQNLISIGIHNCTGVIMQANLPFKSRVPQLKGTIVGEQLVHGSECYDALKLTALIKDTMVYPRKKYNKNNKNLSLWLLCGWGIEAEC